MAMKTFLLFTANVLLLLILLIVAFAPLAHASGELLSNYSRSSTDYPLNIHFDYVSGDGGQCVYIYAEGSGDGLPPSISVSPWYGYAQINTTGAGSWSTPWAEDPIGAGSPPVGTSIFYISGGINDTFDCAGSDLLTEDFEGAVDNTEALFIVSSSTQSYPQGYNVSFSTIELLYWILGTAFISYLLLRLIGVLIGNKW